MNFLNQMGQQFVDLFKSMTPAARLVTGLLVISIGISLFFLFKLQSSAGETYLFGGNEFYQNDISLMSVAFGRSGLNDFEVVGNRIKVPRSKRDLYLKALAEHEAIPESVQGMYEIGQKMNAFMPRSQQVQIARDEKKKNIVRMIKQMPNIQNAVVDFQETEGDGPFRRKEISASISVTPFGSHILADYERRAIFGIIRGAIGIKDPSKITLVDTNTGIPYYGPATDAYDVHNDPYNLAKRSQQDLYANKIRTALSAYNGARVSVEVEIDPTISKHSNEKTIDSTPVTISLDSQKENSTNSKSQSGGVPGVQSNVPGSNGQATVRSQPSQSTLDKSQESSRSIAGGAITTTKTAGLMVKSVSVSVGIPEAYVRKLWQKENPAADGEEPKTPEVDQLKKFFDNFKSQIEDKIRPLIPVRPKGEDSYKDIMVTMDPDIPTDPLPEPGMTDHAMTWLAGNWQSIAVFLFGGFALFALRSMVKSSAPEPETPLADSAQTDSSTESSDKVADTDDSEEKPELKLVGKLDGDPSQVGADEEENELLKRFGASGRPVREQLTELVEQNPDAAATVLRAWIGEAI